VIAEDVIARLERVRKAGDRSWSARCPAHADKGPSLRITDKDGKILIHCFAGCAPADIVAAMGLNLADLFPPRDEHEAANYRRQRFTRSTIKELEHELTLALIVLSDVTSGKVPQPADVERAKVARGRIIKFMRELQTAA
jgi:hypothetical protein